MKYRDLLVASVVFLLVACGDQGGTGPATATDRNDVTENRENPLLAEWNTPFGVPPFDLIESGDYLAALRERMRQQREEIDAIANDAALPTFENTIVALEVSGATLDRVSRIFFAVNGAHSDDIMRETAKTIAPEFAAHNDDIYLDAALFERVDTVYRQRDELDLNAEQRRLLDETHKSFVRAGANLEDDAQGRLREINAELAILSQQFRDNLLDETNDFELLVTDRDDLGALPDSLVALAAEEAKRRGHDCEECWVFTLQRPSINPFLQYSPNREARRKLFEGYMMRGDNDNEHDNKEVVARTAQLRAERAVLMGYPTHAHYVLADNMAETPDNAIGLLDQIWEAALLVSKEDREALEAMMREEGIDDALRGWDWRYYAEKVRKARYAFDEEALRPYFEFSAVRDGVFALSNALWGITFEERDDIPTWHPDQQVFEVRDADGSHLAILYMDFFARETKRGGAWMNSLRAQSNVDGFVSPIVTNNFNFPAPTAGSPSLLSLSEAETLFHEFGHALHGMFSGVTYGSLSGTSTPRDFVEFPSQVMENWMREAEVLKMFARHYRTGEEIPQEIIDKIHASAKFNQGFATVEYVAAAYLDMAYHTLDSPEAIEPRAFEDNAMADIGLIDEILPRYRSGYFSHIFAGGYSAGYYSYIWSEILDADAFQAFRETGLLNRETAARFREEILSKGGTQPGMELYVNFRGREPEIGPLLEKRGLN